MSTPTTDLIFIAPPALTEPEEPARDEGLSAAEAYRRGATNVAIRR